MQISFDLDDTLIPGIKTFTTEPRALLQKLLGTERIRLGTIALFKELKTGGHMVGIYTTSYRSKFSIWLLFWAHGVPVHFIINQKQNVIELSRCGKHCSKYPPAFNIDVHIDDAKGVAMEGERHGFKTIIVDEHCADWAVYIIQNLNLIKAAT